MEFYNLNQLQKMQVTIVQNKLTDATPLIFPHSLKNTAHLPSCLVTCASSTIIPTVRSPNGCLGARSGANKCGNVVMPTVLVIGWMNITLAFIYAGKMFHLSTTVFLWLCLWKILLVYSLKFHARYQTFCHGRNNLYMVPTFHIDKIPWLFQVFFHFFPVFFKFIHFSK